MSGLLREELIMVLERTDYRGLAYAADHDDPAAGVEGPLIKDVQRDLSGHLATATSDGTLTQQHAGHVSGRRW